MSEIQKFDQEDGGHENALKELFKYGKMAVYIYDAKVIVESQDEDNTR